MFSSTAVALFASAALVAGHGIVTEVMVDGTWYTGTKNWDSPDNQKSPVRGIPFDTGFVWYNKVNTPDIACSSAGYTPRPVTAPIKAGGTVGVRWGGDGGPDKLQWPHPEGPILAYLASCEGECSKFNPSNAKFFKISEEGLDPSKQGNSAGNDHVPWGQGMWAQNRIQYENSYSWVTIPEDIAPGEYLLRHELISLHGAHTTAEGAQYYPACIQLKVTGSGTSKPAGTLATQLYSTQDGLVDIYVPSDKHGIAASSYKLPGPALYVPGKASAPQVTTPATTQAPASAAPTTTQPAAAAANTQPDNQSPASSTTQPAYTGRCKAKRSMSLRDESRAVYDRALARAQARHAHAMRRSIH
ncbi:Endoglucanase-4 [Ceratobasidium theobromae]|uniref:Endoglucanase-4 n=1 Tax=Ceratobasidium theobromae TaxID=1582974 RepID=A0A5N5QN11_9AGAM|nr:Endoglucanase-4 [Ceratobasidium theobromae]